MLLRFCFWHVVVRNFANPSDISVFVQHFKTFSIFLKNEAKLRESTGGTTGIILVTVSFLFANQNTYKNASLRTLLSIISIQENGERCIKFSS